MTLRPKALKKKRPSIDKSKLTFGTRKRLKVKKYRDSYKFARCIIQGCNHNPETVVPAHIRSGLLGIGTKPSDFLTLPLCSEHHRIQHELGEKRFWKEYAGWSIGQAKDIAQQRYQEWLNG